MFHLTNKNYGYFIISELRSIFNIIHKYYNNLVIVTIIRTIILYKKYFKGCFPILSPWVKF